MQTFLSRYGAAIAHIVLAVVAALAAVLDKPITFVVAVQLGIVALNSISTYLLPLMGAKWQAGWKVIAAVVGTILAGLVPYLLQGTLTGQNILVLAFSAIGVLAAQIGVDHRVTTAATVPNVDVAEPADAVVTAVPVTVPDPGLPVPVPPAS